jgi:hypothetical protein
MANPFGDKVPMNIRSLAPGQGKGMASLSEMPDFYDPKENINDNILTTSELQKKIEERLAVQYNAEETEPGTEFDPAEQLEKNLEMLRKLTGNSQAKNKD